MVEKVTDPLKIVTDELVLKQLAEQGIDPEYVEFSQDYAMPAIVNGVKEKGKSPYAKFYRDRKSNKHFMVASGLPMVDADGVKIEAGWKEAGSLKNPRYTEKNNLFKASVGGTKVVIQVKNDQPPELDLPAMAEQMSIAGKIATGEFPPETPVNLNNIYLPYPSKKKGDKLTYHAQLFLDGIEQKPKPSVLLPIDPVNPNYANNVLEWDYGICKRRLRIIEGRLLGSWVFDSKPSGIVTIKYNQTGDFKLKLGRFAISDDEEQITPAQFDELAIFQGGYPVTVNDSATFYPDADAESTSVDGYVENNDIGTSWADMLSRAASFSRDSTDQIHSSYYKNYSTSPNWTNFARGFALFDISGLPADVNLISAVESFYGKAKADTLSSAPTNNIYAATPNSNTAIVVGDKAQVGSVAYCDTDITYANWNTGTPGTINDYILNSTGLTALIAAYEGGGIFKTSLRNANYDVAATSPPWTSNGLYSACTAWSSDQGAGYKPKLVVTYTTGWSGGNPLGVAIAGVAKINGIALADIVKVNGVA